MSSESLDVESSDEEEREDEEVRQSAERLRALLEKRDVYLEELNGAKTCLTAALLNSAEVPLEKRNDCDLVTRVTNRFKDLYEEATQRANELSRAGGSMWNNRRRAPKMGSARLGEDNVAIKWR